MTYNVFGGTLNLAQSNPIQLRCHFAFKPEVIGLCWRQLGGITVDPIYTKCDSGPDNKPNVNVTRSPWTVTLSGAGKDCPWETIRVTMRDP